MANSNLGTLTTQISDPQQLLRDQNVSGNGVPAHTPLRAAQTYVDVDSGIKYEWWGGTWH